MRCDDWNRCSRNGVIMVKKSNIFGVLIGPRGSGKLAIRTGSKYSMWSPMSMFKIKKMR